MHSDLTVKPVQTSNSEKKQQKYAILAHFYAKIVQRQAKIAIFQVLTELNFYSWYMTDK